MVEYVNELYPRSLFITKDIEEAKECFVYPDGSPLEKSDSARASVYRVNHKRKNRGDIVLLINRKMDIGTICHEAFHITRTMIEFLPCPLTDETEECWAYLIGWVGTCIQDFIRNEKAVK